MSMMNRLGNAKNPHQTAAKRVLCLCSAGLLRSPTAANVLHSEYGFNTRAAGVTQEYALIPVDSALLYWADEIVCVEPSVMNRLFDGLDETFDEDDKEFLRRKITVLNIPDAFEWNDPKLRNLIVEQYQEASTV